jgi:tetratricopeptide (TPR) repeat protein
MVTRRATKWLAALALLLMLGTGLGAALWWRSRPTLPPEVPLEGLDSEVAEAVREARAEVLRVPRSGEAWGHLGRVLLANEVFPDVSIRCFEQAEGLDPNNPRWPYFCAGALLNLGRRDAMVPKLQRAVVLCDQTEGAPATPRLLLAETLADLGQPEAAAGHFRHGLAASPDNPRAHFGLAMLANARGAWPECRTHLEACLPSPQARKKACAQLATVCERLEDQRSADKYAALAARLPQDFTWSDPYVAEHAHLARRKRDQYRRVEELEARGRLADAVGILNHLVKRYPNDYMPFLTMGKILGQMEQYHLAEPHLQKARELAPDKIQTQYLLGLTLLKHGEALLQGTSGDRPKALALFEEAVRHSRQALTLKPDYGFAHMTLGLALKHLGRRPEALAAFRQAVHCSPEYADIHFFLGVTLAEEGSLRTALAAPAGAWAVMGAALAEDDDLRQARQHLEQARQIAGTQDARSAAALAHFWPNRSSKSETN